MKFSSALNSINHKDKLHRQTSERASTLSAFDVESTNFSNEIKICSPMNPELVMRRFPVLFWIFGIIIIIFATFLMVNSILGPEKGYIKSFSSGRWWEYLTIVIIYIIGILLFILPKYEKLDFSKENNRLTYDKMNFFCCQKEEIAYDISDISCVYPYKTGSYGNGINSVTYFTALRIKGNPIYCLQALTESTAIYDVIEIKKFLYNKEEKYEKIEKEMRDGITYYK